MPANSVRLAVDYAEKFNDVIGLFMQSVGVGGAPVGIRGVYDKWIPYLRTAKTQNTLDDMAGDIAKEASALAAKATELGLDFAEKQLSFYGIDTRYSSDDEAQIITVTNHAVEAVLSKHLSQQAAAALFLTLGYPSSMMFGEGKETGVFSPSSTVQTAITALLGLLWASSGLLVTSSMQATQYSYHKIAVAALDTRTTECCLKVHGQTQLMDKPFHLTGEPRFDDFLDFPPFHWYCRTATALYIPEFDFANIKEALGLAANTILLERSAGLQVPRSPISGLV